MKAFSAVFSIVEEKNCPLYRVGEGLQLSEKTLACPANKEVCLILVRDMTELLFTFLREQPVELHQYRGKVFNCSGCKGLIKFSLVRSDAQQHVIAEEGAGAMIASEAAGIAASVIDSPFLRMFPAEQIASILAQFHEIIVEEGAVLIRKGETNLNLYIVFSGELLVEEGGQQTAIKAGELCGEMSYLGADVAVSTVRAIKKAKVLAIAGDIFGRLFDDNPAVQSFMAQLLAARLRKSSAARARDFESCMIGRIDEIVPAELFQIFHMHQKTGVLSMDLPQGTGRFRFERAASSMPVMASGGMRTQFLKSLPKKRGIIASPPDFCLRICGQPRSEIL
ncbi:MAG: hypothetical protein ACD_75C00400G0007 [uncultured bacterium]|nr:MAG: hypothetical protein ACD_75C00400G0007 [uncultured bacterium]